MMGPYLSLLSLPRTSHPEPGAYLSALQVLHKAVKSGSDRCHILEVVFFCLLSSQERPPSLVC